jgi:hypothetical protein
MIQEDIPDIVQWVLDFLNLRSIPGKSNLNKLPADVITKTFKGVEQCSPTLEDFKQFFLKEGIPPNKGTELLLENGKPLESLNTEVKYPETWYTPTYDDYSFELKLFVQISEGVWSELCRILGNMKHGTKTYDNEGSADESFNGFKEIIKEKYIECLEDDEIPFKGGYSKNRGINFRGIIDVVVDGAIGTDSFPHYGMLPQALYACILDFSYHHKGILSRLKQCLYCGKFEIKVVTKGVRGRVKYCSDECEDKFNSPSRADNLKAQKKLRKTLADDEVELEHDDIIKHLHEQVGFTLKNAEIIYERTPLKNRRSLKEFRRTSGRYHKKSQ